jgi:O-antigen/teichoic acid export membrane protein
MGTTAVVVGSLLAAILAYAFQVFGGRIVGPGDFAPITILWTVQFLAMQVLYQPLEHYVNRETGRGRAPSMLHPLVFGAGSALATVAVLLLFRDRYFIRLVYVAMAGALVFGYAIFGYVRGRLAGSRAFVPFGVVTAGEAGIRVVLAISLAWTFGAVGLGLAMVIAPFIAVAWLPQTGVSGLRGEFAKSLPPLVTASAFGQALLGLPPVVAALVGADAATISVVFMTFAMYRGPIWVLQGVMARLLPAIVNRIEDGRHADLHGWTRRVVVGGVVLAGVALVVGGSLGPPVFGLLLGEGFRPPARFSGVIAAGVVLAACAGLLNQGMLAHDRLTDITRAWLLGFIVAAVLVVAVPGSPYLRIGVAFLAGELVALAGLYYRFPRDVDVVEALADSVPEADAVTSAADAVTPAADAVTSAADAVTSAAVRSRRNTRTPSVIRERSSRRRSRRTSWHA